MLYNFTVVVNFIDLAVAVWLGIYIVTRGSRSLIAWLAGFVLWSVAGFSLNVLLALNPPPSPALIPLWIRPLLWFWPAGGTSDYAWGNWLQGWQITPAIMIWHHLTVLIRPGRMNAWRWTRVLVGYAIAIAAILGQRYTALVFTSIHGDLLYLTTLVPGPLYPAYMGSLFIFTLLSLINLIRSARAAPTLMHRKQLNLMVAATLIAGLAGPIAFISYLLSMLLPRVTLAILLGCAVFLLGYGVARYSALIEGRVIGRDFLYNGVVVLLTAGLYLLVVWSAVDTYSVPVATLAIVVILAILTHSLVDIGRRVFDFVFYSRETRELRAGLRSLAGQVNEAEALEETLSMALETLCGIVRATYGLIFLFREDHLKQAASFRWQHSSLNLPLDILVSDDVVRLSAGKFQAPLEEAALLIPLYSGETQQGVLILGRPENAISYANSDVERLLDASDRIADVIRDSRRESEHLAQLARLAQSPPPMLDLEAELPTKAVEEALRNLYDYAYLSDSPLSELRRVRALASGDGITHLDRGKYVYQMILAALEKLRPPGDLPRESIPRQWYPYLILNDAYLKNKPNREIMMRLYISEGSFNRARRAAVRSMARVLTEMNM